MKTTFYDLIKIMNHEEIHFEKIDLSKLLLLAKSHRIVGIIYLALRKYNKAPISVISRFKEESRLIQNYALKQFQTLIEIQNLFKSNSIPMLCIKGITLSQLLYNDISVRESKDIDILIAYEKISIAHQVLISNGFVLSNSLEEFKFNHIYLIKDVHKDLIYHHPENNIELELHWRLDHPFVFNPSFDELWERRQCLTIQNHEFQTLSNEDYCLFLCLHGSRSTWRRLQWLCDYHKAYELFLSSDAEKRTHDENIIQYRITNQYNLAINLVKYVFRSDSLSMKKTIENPPLLTRYIALKHMKSCNAEYNGFYLRILNFIYEITLFKSWNVKRNFIKHKFRLVFLRTRTW